MKSLSEFIREKLEGNDFIEISDLEVIYIPDTENLLVQVPNNYNEDNIHMYLDDSCMPDMPSDPKNIGELFGSDNSKNLSDAYFQYEDLTLPEDSTTKPQIEWNKRYDNHEDRNAELIVYSLNNFEYHILFEKFEINNRENLELEKILEDLFTAAESNKIHPWAFPIKLKEINFK
ncbi:MAG: hypothetical protein J1F35_03350 [Erysipelotrichales bacterium]|nr:hypothetical protein [Erysipelotrichales bacterium]